MLSFTPSETLNFILGQNNAGKTTILESVYLASTSKSFKSSDLDKLANYNANGYKISIKFNQMSSNDVIIFEKYLNKPKKLYLNEKHISVSQSMRSLPIQILNFGNQNIFNQKSDVRRSFIDWGVFHVEPKYGDELKSLTAILQARNKVLKQRSHSEIKVWTEKFVDVALRINSMRQAYFDKLNAEFYDFWSSLNLLKQAPVRAGTCFLHICYLSVKST